jgi:mannose-6-phosphate isomerase
VPKLPQLLEATPHHRRWGTRQTEPWFRNREQEVIGEVWFEASGSVPLVKFLFTADNLSVQVHPEDAYAAKHHNGSFGKTEMWHILRAEPGARVALGLNRAVEEDELREACQTGGIVEMLNWIPTAAGDTFFTPARTIHAIGGGITLCEVQQFSDITYRLYDWGRVGRELHLDHGIAVADRSALVGGARLRSGEVLAECAYFRTKLREVRGAHMCPSPSTETIYVVLEGSGTIAGAQFEQGQAWKVPADAEPFEIASPGATFLITAVP